MRSDKRAALEIRQMHIRGAVQPFAIGSAEAHFGATHVLAVVQSEGLPSGQQVNGLLEVSLKMLPLSTRMGLEDPTEAAAEQIALIERLSTHALSASLRAANVRSHTFKVFVSVLVADGGVAAASIAAGWVALYQALSRMAAEGAIDADLDLPRVASVSGGIVRGEARIDLTSEEISTADFHVVVAAAIQGGVIAVEAEGENLSTDHVQMSTLVEHCLTALNSIYEAQAKAVLALDA